MKIVHITTVHQRFDSRIFYKECIALQRRFNDVTLIVADGKGDGISHGIKIIDVGLDKSRIKRLVMSSRSAVKKALSLNADVYHFHDPDLLISARKLCKNAAVIFDSHEDFPKLMLQRPYIPKALRKILFSITQKIEKNTYKKLAAVVTATENIRQKFLSYGYDKAVTVKNYPIIRSDTANAKKTNTSSDSSEFTCCYAGGLTQIRGVKEMICACEKASAKLILAGPFDDSSFLEEMKALSGWKNVEYLGTVPHKELYERVYSRSDVGLNMLLAAPNHTYSIPIKQLEYMAAGLPVIATEHIEFCKQITKETQCGMLVIPENTDECAKAILFLKNNPQQRSSMGNNGRKAALNKYNWQAEEKKLIELYLSLIK